MNVSLEKFVYYLKTFKGSLNVLALSLLVIMHAHRVFTF